MLLFAHILPECVFDVHCYTPNRRDKSMHPLLCTKRYGTSILFNAVLISTSSLGLVRCLSPVNKTRQPASFTVSTVISLSIRFDGVSTVLISQMDLLPLTCHYRVLKKRKWCTIVSFVLWPLTGSHMF